MFVVLKDVEAGQILVWYDGIKLRGCIYGVVIIMLGHKTYEFALEGDYIAPLLAELRNFGSLSFKKAWGENASYYIFEDVSDLGNEFSAIVVERLHEGDVKMYKGKSTHLRNSIAFRNGRRELIFEYDENAREWRCGA